MFGFSAPDESVFGFLPMQLTKMNTQSEFKLQLLKKKTVSKNSRLKHFLMQPYKPTGSENDTGIFGLELEILQRDLRKHR